MRVRQEVYDTYWKTAAERQEIFYRKLRGDQPPYTNDPIFALYKFCNVYRASDRVSQFLIKEVIYKQPTNSEDALFRVFLFRLLNKNETWEKLVANIGEPSLKNFSAEKYATALESIRQAGEPIYGNAFILCANKAFGFDVKHKNHLALLEQVFQKDNYVGQILKAKSLEDLFLTLRALPLIGDFMAYQLAIDFNYSEVFNFDENDFTVAGPGAVRGIKKCFQDTGEKSNAYIIKYMVENQEKEFKRLGLNFHNLFGRPMHAIDCQGWFCETDKYSRAKFPELTSNRVRIKTKYQKTSKPLDLFYPPKWQLKVS